MRIMGVRENVMRKIGNIFKILFWAAPFSTAVTVLYYICQAIIPALSTILFAGILQGVIEFWSIRGFLKKAACVLGNFCRKKQQECLYIIWKIQRY